MGSNDIVEQAAMSGRTHAATVSIKTLPVANPNGIKIMESTKACSMKHLMDSCMWGDVEVAK